MEFNEVLNYVLYIILTVILPVVSKYIITLLKAKIQESEVITEVSKNEKVSVIVKEALTDVMDAVLYVNQTYCDSLKEEGRFDKEAQNIAFNKAKAQALTMISDGTKVVIEELYGSFDEWLNAKIESSVNLAKK